MLRRGYPQWRRAATPIALALLSLLAALVLWIAVTGAENPTRVAVFSGAIEVKAVNVPEGLAVASIREPVVSLRVSADEDAFDRLTAADFEAEVDLSGVRQPSSDQVVIARVVGRRDVEIVAVTPAVVAVVLETEATKQVPVRANRVGAPPQGYSVSKVEPKPDSVRIRGATSLVGLVDSAAADVNLTGLRVSIQQQYTLTPRDARGLDIEHVSIEPASADVSITIAQQEVTVALPILPQMQGSVADGYRIVAVTTDPAAVGVSGPLTLLQALSYLMTEPIDVSGLNGDLTRTVRLRLPAELRATRDSVSVFLRVAPAQGEIVLNVAPRVTELGEGLQAAVQTASIGLRLRGPMPTLRTLGPDSVSATVSAAGLGEGVYVLTAAVSVPANVEVVSVEPTSVVLVLRR